MCFDPYNEHLLVRVAIGSSQPHHARFRQHIMHYVLPLPDRAVHYFSVNMGRLGFFGFLVGNLEKSNIVFGMFNSSSTEQKTAV